MEKQTTLLKKLLKIQKAVMGLKRDASGNNYKYVSGDKVLEHIKPVMNEEGILLSMEVLSLENTRQDYKLKSGFEKSEILTKANMKFTWICVDTGETLECLWAANGQNDWDKGAGSAYTYGERYFLLKFFHIATDEDDVDNPARKKEEAKEEPKPQAKKQEEPKPKILLTTAHKNQYLTLLEQGSKFEKGKVEESVRLYHNNVEAITKKGVGIDKIKEFYDLEPDVEEHYALLIKK